MLKVLEDWVAENHAQEEIELCELNVLKLEERPAHWHDFDVVATSSMLEYVPRAALPDALKGLISLLKPGGRLILCPDHGPIASHSRFDITSIHGEMRKSGLLSPTLRHPVDLEENTECLLNVGGGKASSDLQRQGTPSELVDDHEDLQPAAIHGLLCNEVVAPDMVWVLGPMPNASLL
jgi:SAM-dependent methyltransferase